MAEEWWSFVKGTVWVTHFKHISVHKYTRVARGQGVEIKSMIDVVLVKRDMLQYMQDVR